jgi:hypothetical protein
MCSLCLRLDQRTACALLNSPSGCESFVILNEVKDPARSSARYQRVQEHARSLSITHLADSFARFAGGSAGALRSG